MKDLEDGMFDLWRSEAPNGQILVYLSTYLQASFDAHQIPMKVELVPFENGGGYLEVDCGGGINVTVEENRDNGWGLYGLFVKVEVPEHGEYVSELGLGSYVSAGYFYLSIVGIAFFAWNFNSFDKRRKSTAQKEPDLYKILLSAWSELVTSWKEGSDLLAAEKAELLSMKIGL